jgi:hypothetical protein
MQNQPELDAIFIVGTGRSGTHFTCRALSGFANIFDPMEGIENFTILNQIARSAIYHRDLPQKVIKYYQNRKNNKKLDEVFLDQHPPNIFFTNQLSEVFRNAIFLFPYRPVVQVVASMLQHEGILSWYELAHKSFKPFSSVQRLPIPNRFLGIDSRKELTDFKLHELCALRVLSHNLTMKRLTLENKNCRMISYEGLIIDQKAEFSTTFSNSELDKLGTFSLIEKSNPASARKYKSVLTQDQISDILEIEESFNEKNLGWDT